jgi:hypothetical protein
MEPYLLNICHIYVMATMSRLSVSLHLYSASIVAKFSETELSDTFNIMLFLKQTIVKLV